MLSYPIFLFGGEAGTSASNAVEIDLTRSESGAPPMRSDSMWLKWNVCCCMCKQQLYYIINHFLLSSIALQQSGKDAFCREVVVVHLPSGKGWGL